MEILPCQSGASPPSQRRSSYLQSYLKLSLRLLNRLSKNWKSINRHSTIECVWRTPNRLTLVSEKTDFEQNTTCRGYRIRAQVLYRYPSRRRTLYPTALRQLRRSGHTRLKRQQNRRSGSKKASREIFPDRRVTSNIIHKIFVNLSKIEISDFLRPPGGRWIPMF